MKKLSVMMVTIVIATLLLTVNAVAPVQAKRPPPPDYRATGKLILGVVGGPVVATYDYELKGYKNKGVSVRGTVKVEVDYLVFVYISLEIRDGLLSSDWSPNPAYREWDYPDVGSYLGNLYSWDQKTSQIKQYTVYPILGAYLVGQWETWDYYVWYL